MISNNVKEIIIKFLVLLVTFFIISCFKLISAEQGAVMAAGITLLDSAVYSIRKWKEK